MHRLPTYELLLGDADKIALALVDSPAIESNFIFFSSDDVIKMDFNEEQMIVKGPALIPNRKIYRNDKFGERNVFMSEKTVRTFAENLINKQGTKFNLGHTDNTIEASLVESYFTSETNEFGLPKGSWIIALKLKSIDAWEQVKNGELKGFSIEGLFSNEFSNFNINKNKEMDLKEKLMTAINTVLFNETPVVVETPVVEETPVTPEEVVTVELAETPVTPEVPAEEETVQLTPEMVQQMIDASLVVAVEAVISQVKEMLGQKETEVEVEMSAMKAKIEEFGAQPLSKPITETVVNAVKLTGDYAYLSGINK